MTFEEIISIPPYSLGQEEKKNLLTKRILQLTDYHREHCSAYGNILKAVHFQKDVVTDYRDIPFLPVRLFKELELKSVSDEDVVKVMTSSGTTGQAVSKIYLDRATSSNQQKAMVKIVSDFAGSARMPMILIDCPSVVKNRAMFSARGAGILGFSIFGSKKIYALDEDMRLNVEGLGEFLEIHKGKRILLFGFTFMIWQHFYKELLKLKAEGITFDLSQGILIHGGGWKKLQSEAVSGQEFHDRIKDVCSLVSHIAPSNVPVNFAYSLVAGLLMGNANIVRVPSKNFPQVEFIIRAVERILPEHEDVRPYVSLIRYGRERRINDILSSIADVRVIWGGDATIGELRKSPLPPRSTEVTFADRFSLGWIQSCRETGEDGCFLDG